MREEEAFPRGQRGLEQQRRMYVLLMACIVIGGLVLFQGLLQSLAHVHQLSSTRTLNLLLRHRRLES